MSKHRLGLIGYGKIATDQHLPALAKSADLRLAAVASRHADRIPGVDKVFADYKTLLAEGDIEAVSICSATKDHFSTARDALLAGKSVLLEKPPAITLGQAQALATLAEAQKVVLFATWHAREHAAVDEAAKRLEGQQIARLKMTWKEDVHRWHPGQAWVWEAGGFGVFDPGINGFSILTRIMPTAIAVSGGVLHIPANQQTPVAAELTFSTEPPSADLAAELDWRQTGDQIWEIDLETAAGVKLRLIDGGAKLEVDGAMVVDHASAEYERLYARFAELLESGQSDVDLRPLQLVADAFLCGERRAVEALTP